MKTQSGFGARGDLATGLSLLVLIIGLSAEDGHAFDPGLAGFSVEIMDVVNPYEVFAVYSKPASDVVIRIQERDQTGEYTGVAVDGRLTATSAFSWTWSAPSGPGLYTIVLRHSTNADSMLINAFVIVPMSKVTKGYLNGYRIGTYPSEPYKGLSVYEPPDGFIEATPELTNTRLSPHFTLSQFLCKQASDWPKYVILREALLLKLELVLAEANRAGHACETFSILSGFRTPHYNKSIGNVKYSRHQWGGAADIFIDENPRDGMMDDLNADGMINWKDAAVLYELVDNLYGQAVYEPFIGGLGRYKKTASHGPFVHVDVRGFRARWGD